MKYRPVRHKTNKQHVSLRSMRKSFVQPRSLEEFLAMPERYQDVWRNIGQVTTEVRSGSTLAQASRKFDIDPRTVQRLAKPALRKLRNGRWAAKKSDRLLRVLPLPSPQGLIDVGVPDSRQATLIGYYWNAVDLYLGTGDASALQAFQGEDIVDAEGRRVPLMTDLRELDRQESAGNLSFESMYARVA
jgi:hypothetical protein